MGNRLEVIGDAIGRPETMPDITHPTTFEPTAGFEDRPKREMKATWEEMERAQLELHERDYCAHLLIPWRKCQQESFPLSAHYCAHEKHAYIQCEGRDMQVRMMEFERERRLLRRRERKLAAEKSEE